MEYYEKVIYPEVTSLAKQKTWELSCKRPFSCQKDVTKLLATYLWERSSRISLLDSELKFAYASNMFY